MANKNDPNEKDAPRHLTANDLVGIAIVWLVVLAISAITGYWDFSRKVVSASSNSLSIGNPTAIVTISSLVLGYFLTKVIILGKES